MIVAEKLDDVFARAFGVLAGDVDLGAVARGQHDRLGGRRPCGQRLDGGAEVAAREVEPLPHVDGRRLVTDAEQKQMHY